MVRLKVTVSEKVTYSDSSGRKYSGPLQDAPDYVRDAVKDMNKLLQSMDETISSLLCHPGSTTHSYKMTIGEAFDWRVLLAIVGTVLAVGVWFLVKLLLGE